jgi:hypothetical protein
MLLLAMCKPGLIAGLVENVAVMFATSSFENVGYLESSCNVMTHGDAREGGGT